ncbi:protein arginine kinase [Mucisphaera sp.]|uniref:protein arginine kinase n=1 Tax=Mucisphaera sp. TaxID=2913024 RepID=UPI003D0FD6C6
MSLSQIPDHAGEWLRGTGPHGEVVISSRIRYARNLAGFPFVHRSNRRQQHEVLHLVKDEISARQFADNVIWVDMLSSPSLDRQLLVERHLVSRELASEKKAYPRGVVIAPDETFAVMINEEDHIRLQVLRSGMQLSEAFAHIERLDNALEGSLDFAYANRFGYLTACPTNVGTGLRVSVMLHLPALKLTGEIEKVRRAARDTHLAVRGLFGEGSEALGDLYQVSNQSTLGKTEQEIVSDFEHTIVPQVIAYEQQARQALLKQRPAQLDDKIHRAWAVLTHARVLGTEEVLSLLSHLRLGVNLGRIQSVDLRTLNELLLLTQPAHLQRLVGQPMDAAERKIARATMVRERLVGGGKG